MSYVTSTKGSSVDPPTKPVTSKSTSATPRSDPHSASRCSPHSEEADGIQARTTEQSSLSYSDTISASKDISNQSTTHADTQRVDGTPTISAEEPTFTSLTGVEPQQGSPSLKVESGTQRSPDSHSSDITPAGLHPKPVRNIVILGKTGAGKATIANVIVDHPMFNVSTSVEGITRSARDSTASYESDDFKYNIKLIDTVGVEDTKFRRQHLLHEITSFLKTIDCIHLIIFVFKNSRFTKEDSEAFGYIADVFEPVIKDISLLVITCCEVLSKDARNRLVVDFETKQSTKNIADVVKNKGIEPVGFPNLETVRAPLIPIYKESVKEDSEKLRKIVKSCTKSVSQDAFKEQYLQKNPPSYSNCLLL